VWAVYELVGCAQVTEVVTMADHPMAAEAMTVAVAAAVVTATETAATPAEVVHCNCYSHSLIAVFFTMGSGAL